MCRTHRPYPSDLSDAEWALLEPLLASSERRGRPPKWRARRIADEVFYLLTAGCIDTDLPAGRRNFGRSGKPLIEIAHVHHALWVTFTETRCKGIKRGPESQVIAFTNAGFAPLSRVIAMYAPGTLPLCATSSTSSSEH